MLRTVGQVRQYSMKVLRSTNATSVIVLDAEVTVDIVGTILSQRP